MYKIKNHFGLEILNKEYLCIYELRKVLLCRLDKDFIFEFDKITILSNLAKKSLLARKEIFQLLKIPIPFPFFYLSSLCAALIKM